MLTLVFMTFLCDQMLGSLAKWLRLCGFDTAFATQTTTDESLLNKAQKEQRALITRDKQLIAQAKKKLIPVIEIKTIDLDEQLTTVLKYITINPKDILSRCSECNTPLISVEKETIKSCVPPKIFLHKNCFWSCPTCKKTYWKGTHYDAINKKISKLQLQNKTD